MRRLLAFQSVGCIALLRSGTQVFRVWQRFLITVCPYIHLHHDLADEETEVHLSNLIPQTQEIHILVCLPALVPVEEPHFPHSRLPCPLEPQPWRLEDSAPQKRLFWRLAELQGRDQVLKAEGFLSVACIRPWIRSLLRQTFLILIHWRKQATYLTHIEVIKLVSLLLSTLKIHMERFPLPALLVFQTKKTQCLSDNCLMHEGKFDSINKDGRLESRPGEKGRLCQPDWAWCQGYLVTSQLRQARARLQILATISVQLTAVYKGWHRSRLLMFWEGYWKGSFSLAGRHRALGQGRIEPEDPNSIPNMHTTTCHSSSRRSDTLL